MNNEHLKESFGTLSETVNGLVNSGYTLDFNIKEACIVCNQMDISLSPNDFQIDKVYRFEGASDPDDSSIVYAISSDKFSVKGILVNGYGIYADDISSELVEKLQTHSEAVATEQSSVDSTVLRPQGNRVPPKI